MRWRNRGPGTRDERPSSPVGGRNSLSSPTMPGNKSWAGQPRMPHYFPSKTKRSLTRKFTSEQVAIVSIFASK
jgi:hypothetical protein